MAGATCRVIVNDRCLRNPQTGVGRYVTELLAGLERVAPEVQTLGFFSRLRSVRGPGPNPSRSGQTAPSRVTPMPTRPASWLRRAAQSLYESAFELAGAISAFDLYHEPNHIAMPWHGPIVTTMHDLSVLRYPEWHPADRVDWYEREFEASLARTHHFITVSQFTRQEMIDLLGVQPERITAIPLGIGPAFRPLEAQAVSAWRRGAGLPEAYLLFVGTLEPRKNVPGLLCAYAALPAGLRERYALVFAGISGWGGQDVLDLAQRCGVGGQVALLGYLPDAELPLLYNAAHALIWPTFYEGFGLPPLEAMACGTPVITSNTSSLPEVTGDAALRVDPHASEQIAAAIERLLDDPGLHADLAAAGPVRARQFTWDRCAAAHAAVYRGVLES